MQVPINIEVLIGLFSVLFIPLFIFFVKLVIDFTTIKTKLDAVILAGAEMNKNYEEVDELRSDLRILEMRVKNLENEIKKSPV